MRIFGTGLGELRFFPRHRSREWPGRHLPAEVDEDRPVDGRNAGFLRMLLGPIERRYGSARTVVCTVASAGRLAPAVLGQGSCRCD